MLTKLICRNFKCFGEVEVELGNPCCLHWPKQLRQNNRFTGTRPLGYGSQTVEREP